MRVVIDLGVAEDAASWPWLDRILYLVEDSWHLWDVLDGEAMLRTPWLRDPGRAGRVARDLLKKSVVRGGYPSSIHRSCIRVSRDPKSTAEFSPEAASRFLAQPLTILVENRKSDGAFLDAIVETLGGQELREHWQRDPPLVRKDSLGGKGQMNDHVKQQAKGSLSPRLLVICDGDGDYPGHRPRGAATLKNNCIRFGIGCWILEKREAENYLPTSLLERLTGSSAEAKEDLDSWRRLSAEQKDFYDVKRGLAEIRSSPRKDLFANLEQEDIDRLEAGFGDSASALWGIRPIDEADLRRRAGVELDYFIDLLCGLI